MATLLNFWDNRRSLILPKPICFCWAFLLSLELALFCLRASRNYAFQGLGHALVVLQAARVICITVMITLIGFSSNIFRGEEENPTDEEAAPLLAEDRTRNASGYGSCDSTPDNSTTATTWDDTTTGAEQTSSAPGLLSIMKVRNLLS